jgi:hypothetical protein
MVREDGTGSVEPESARWCHGLAHLGCRTSAPWMRPLQARAAYVAPESDRATLIDAPIILFDGAHQREAQRLAEEALGENG